MDLITREAVKKLTKEMYLKVANTEYNVHSISDCTSYVASKCREYIDNRIQAGDVPSAFDGKTNWEALKTIFPYAEIVGGDITLTAVRIDTTGTGTPVCLYTEWLDAPYSTIPKVRNEWTI